MMAIYENIWYLVLCVSVIFYTVLDGFDLGVGALHLFARDDRERRVFLNAIGPVWDGNEVWLIIIFGGMFAGFPAAYATICESFYTLIMILLAAIIFRAVAIEFRSKVEHKKWRFAWDVIFSFSSILMAFIIGVIMANLIQGIPLDQNGDFVGTFGGFFTPYSILLGFTACALFAMHGAVFLLMKTEGTLHDHVRKWINPAIVVFLIFYVMTTLATLMYMPHMLKMMRSAPWLFVVALIAMLAIANVPRCIYKGNDGFAFISSSCCIAFLFFLFGIGIYPNLVRSSINPEHFSLNLYNAGAAASTYKVILTVACIGVPLVLAYGFWIYRIFRGKVTLDDTSY
ncbi:cytochrome d ubiquinol oxidase subunit II [Simkania sp.]|uniref:cytochrome d ubiquinol oxidase subunit II n=1 Tax=Simkania sp. TaxID=34094 RepID=UPI003B524974